MSRPESVTSTVLAETGAARDLPRPAAVPREESITHPLLQVRGLTKAYGRRTAVQGLDLEVWPGEIVGFLGPNGAGKTTVIRVLTGALRATAGTVTVLGRDPFGEAAEVHRSLGYVPGDLRLPGHLTGQQFLKLCASLRGSPDGERDRLLERFRVPLDVRIGELSKGNRQKLGLVQALMAVPDVLLLDEPSSGLDPLAQEVLEAELRRAATRGAAVLLSSHALAEVEQVADRVVMLREGRLLASADLEELRAHAPYAVEVDGSVDVVALRRVPGVHDLEPRDTSTTFTVTAASLDDVLDLLAAGHIRDLRIAPADLERLFLRYYEGV